MAKRMRSHRARAHTSKGTSEPQAVRPLATSHEERRELERLRAENARLKKAADALVKACTSFVKEASESFVPRVARSERRVSLDRRGAEDIAAWVRGLS